MLLSLSLLASLAVGITVARGLGPLGWPLVVVTAPAGVVGALLLSASHVSQTPLDAGTEDSDQPKTAVVLPR